MPKLFSYGTLQQEEVQLATFGRRLTGQRDQLTGFVQTEVEIDDPDVVAASGKTHHPILIFTGLPGDRVSGTVVDITETELAQADDYEVEDYKRVAVTLASGMQAWVYVDARHEMTHGAMPTQAKNG